jgi:hypothetical protein
VAIPVVAVCPGNRMRVGQARWNVDLALRHDSTRVVAQVDQLVVPAATTGLKDLAGRQVRRGPKLIQGVPYLTRFHLQTAAGGKEAEKEPLPFGRCAWPQFDRRAGHNRGDRLDTAGLRGCGCRWTGRTGRPWRPFHARRVATMGNVMPSCFGELGNPDALTPGHTSQATALQGAGRVLVRLIRPVPLRTPRSDPLQDLKLKLVQRLRGRHGA